jgi:hypothetical protein
MAKLAKHLPAHTRHILGLYTRRGIAHGPVQRNLIIPELACRTLRVLGDQVLTAELWPSLMTFMRWWFAEGPRGTPNRDGSRSGLISLGTDLDPAQHPLGTIIQEAMDESGYDELPTYSAGFANGRRGLLAPGVGYDRASQCLTGHDLGQSCLYARSALTLASLADELGNSADAGWLRGEAARMIAAIRTRLYDPEAGHFRDRRWDGSWSPTLTMTVFYPLLVPGLCDMAVAARLRDLLTDPRHFWTERLIPTVSRSDPAYRDSLDGAGNYWRGNCWPPTTWIVLQAVRQAGWHVLAAEISATLHAQFQTSWQAHVHAYENEPPEGAIDRRFLYLGGWGGREIRYTWAGLLELARLEEVAAPEGVGLRIGPRATGIHGAWQGFHWQGARLAVTTDATGTTLAINGREVAWLRPGTVLEGLHRTPTGWTGTVAGQTWSAAGR